MDGRVPLFNSLHNPGKSDRRESGSDKLSSYEYVKRPSSVLRAASSLAGTEVSVDEIRSAAAISHSDIYPPSLHSALLSPPQPQLPSPPYGSYTYAMLLLLYLYNNPYAFLSSANYVCS